MASFRDVIAVVFGLAMVIAFIGAMVIKERQKREEFLSWFFGPLVFLAWGTVAWLLLVWLFHR